MKDVFHVLNHVLCDLFLCTSHVSEIDETRAHFMHAIASNLPVDVSRLMFNLILEASLDNSSREYLPFGLLITDFLGRHQIVFEPHEISLLTGKPISKNTLRMSNALLGVAPLPSQLQSYVVDFDPMIRLLLLPLMFHLPPLLLLLRLILKLLQLQRLSMSLLLYSLI